MMKVIDISGVLVPLKLLGQNLSEKEISTIVSGAINRSLLEGRTESRRTVKDTYNLPQSQMKLIDIRKANRSNLQGFIFSSTKPVPLDAFDPIYISPSKKIRTTKKGQQKVSAIGRSKKDKGRGVSVEIKRGSRVFVQYAFMIQGGKPRVFARGNYQEGIAKFATRNKRERKTGTDIHINPLMSITVYQTTMHPNSINRTANKIIENFEKNFLNELNYRVSRRQA